MNDFFKICTYTGRGHLTYYLKKYRNLYRYLQQGVESSIGYVKTLYHGWTNGGGYAQRNTKQSHLLGVVNFCIQEMLFWLKNGNIFFENIIYVKTKKDDTDIYEKSWTTYSTSGYYSAYLP